VRRDTVVAVSDFANEPLLVNDLPELHDDNFVAVDPNLLRISLIGTAMFAAAVVIAAVIVAILGSDPTWVPIAIFGGLLGLALIRAGMRIIEIRHIAYQIRTHDLSYRSGVLIKTVATVPFVRIQHARIRQGPVQRRFGLATLEVSSAGPDLEIRGLAIETAERLKVLVVDRAGDLDESGTRATTDPSSHLT